MVGMTPVSYTHLDVYKRQGIGKDLARVTSYVGDRYYFVCTKTCVVRAITKELLIRQGLVDPYDYYMSNC